MAIEKYNRFSGKVDGVLKRYGISKILSQMD